MSSISPASEKKQWWFTNRKIVDKHIRDSRDLIATQEPSNVSAALSLLDAALAISPHSEAVLELKARCLLFLRRFRDVANMLQEYIPSYKVLEDDSSNSLCSSDGSKLISKDSKESSGSSSFRCFSVSDLKTKLMFKIRTNCEKESQWRYMILGQACFHLGLLDDAMALLQTGRRLAVAAFRRESGSQSDDNFNFTKISEPESANLLSHIKLLLRRKSAALAALDAGIPSESIRHFSKILDRRGTPHSFAASCFIHRAAAYHAAGRIADAISDCNRALSLDPTSIPALRARADLLESIRAFPDCLRDLDHLKMLYDMILRDRKAHCGVRYRDVAGNLRSLTVRIQENRKRVASGDGCNVDYYSLIGVRRGCTRSELMRVHLLLALKHKPEKAAAFVDRLEYADEHRDVESVRDQARMSGLILYRMIQKGFSSIMLAVMDDEAAERQRKNETAASVQKITVPEQYVTVRAASSSSIRDNVGSFCRNLDLGRAMPVVYEAVRC